MYLYAEEDFGNHGIDYWFHEWFEDGEVAVPLNVSTILEKHPHASGDSETYNFKYLPSNYTMIVRER